MATERKKVNISGNEAVAYVAHKINEVCAIYPITPSSDMGEFADEFSAKGQTNIWGTVPTVVEMQSEGGAAGACHGALQAGSLTTTFTASQGLLLMIPNMFKIAGELTPTVFHIAARSVATHALSIFGDHSDVMAARSTGWGMCFSGSIQEVMDFTLISQACSLESRLPMLNCFDGFRSSHEIQKVEQLTIDDMKAMIDDKYVNEHRQRALSPDHPVIRGTAQNPDVFFQARETINPFYDKAPDTYKQVLKRFAKLTGREYNLFDYVGAPDAERIIIAMGSSVEAITECVEHLNQNGEKVGLIKIRVFRPFSIKDFVDAVPSSVKVITALDRTKEPGGTGEPLYTDVITALAEAGRPLKVVGGRYGLSSKEFNPAMVKAVYDNMSETNPKNHFTVGIEDDVTHTSLKVDESFTIEDPKTVRAMFWGLGSDGTVGANKNSIKIIGEGTDNYAQGYFVYDSKKAGSVTVSHLRFGPNPIRSTYKISSSNFIACHQALFLEKYDVLKKAVKGGTFLLNSHHPADKIWDELPKKVQEQILEKELKFYVIDAYTVAHEAKMGVRINSIMQTCFFYISGILPKDEAIAKIKDAIKKTYGKKGDEIVQMNYNAVDMSIENLHEVKTPGKVTSAIPMVPPVPENAPDFVKNVLGTIIGYDGDSLPVSAMPKDGTFPTGTTRWEKRNLAEECPVWESDICIQCGKCSLACPNAVIRAKIYDPAHLEGAPQTFKSVEARGKDYKEKKYTLQVAVEDCTGCGICITACPTTDKNDEKRKPINMAEQFPIRKSEAENFAFFETIKELPRSEYKLNSIKGSQFCTPLFEFAGNCAGCGETPYLKLMTQLFGDRCLVANATGCTSIYCGNLPTTPFSKDRNGRGPAWSNSLFEDNAEFGMGFRVTIDQQIKHAKDLVTGMKSELGSLADDLLAADQSTEAGIAVQRDNVAKLKEKLTASSSNEAKNLLNVADFLVDKSVWIVGGDGWAFDIGYGGLDHVLASGRNVNVLVLDTGVYSNTGGQCSKATPLGAVAKFAFGGKPSGRKDLGLMAMSYGDVYVAQVAMGASDAQVVKAFVEAEAYDGPSIIIAYSHCIAHGIDMTNGLSNQKAAVESGFWPLYRYDPRRADSGENPLKLDSKEPKIAFADWANSEARFKMLKKIDAAQSEKYLAQAQEQVTKNWKFYEQMAAIKYEK